MHAFEQIQRLADDALIQRLTHSVKGDRQLAARMLFEMGEVEARGLFRDLGFSSMFEYATKKLGMSESEAGLRLRVARLGRSVPAALVSLARGEVNLSTLSMLGDVLTPDTLELLGQARFKTKAQVFELLARHAPKPDVPDSVRQLPSARPRARASRAKPPAVLPLAHSHDANTADETPRDSFRHKVTFTASQRVRDLLAEAQDLLRNRIPDGDLEPIFEQALELLVTREKKRQFAQTDTPRSNSEAHPTEPSRYVANDVRREVYARDGGQCCFIGPDGQRCSARARLEFDHEKPYAQGGLSSAGNLRLMCRSHNALLAERTFGRAFMQARIAEKRNTDDPRGPAARCAPSRDS